ncbi:MAG: hypothetical protein GY868_21895, partial [Deltaproteobacteria bacterium]|nr:hypothetical protein [Deltaproteobacteria bacterium]
MNTFLTVKETFDEVYGMLPIPVFLFDGNAQMVCANPAFLELARVTVRELPQLSVGIFFEVVRTFRFPVPERYVTELKTRDNAVIPVELNHIK